MRVKTFLSAFLQALLVFLSLYGFFIVAALGSVSVCTLMAEVCPSLLSDC